jgi:DNA polymerase III epsilon subunit-like protein
MYARNYCFNDIYEGEYGDLYVDVEEFLGYLRPTLRGGATYRRLDLLRDRCPQCEQSNFYHEDWCTAEDEADASTSRRKDAIAAHLHCVEMAQALIDHTARCIARTEEIAHRARVVTTEAAGVAVVKPHPVLSSIRLEDLNQPPEPLNPATLATAIQPALEDVSYCDEDDPYHSEPHRACRYLVS